MVLNTPISFKYGANGPWDSCSTIRFHTYWKDGTHRIHWLFSQCWTLIEICALCMDKELFNVETVQAQIAFRGFGCYIKYPANKWPCWIVRSCFEQNIEGSSTQLGTLYNRGNRHKKICSYSRSATFHPGKHRTDTREVGGPMLQKPAAWWDS